ncbi:MAG: alcohol dehydrogenase catalytic domain-containing protein [Elusimicrobiota bacterium]
MKALVFHRRRDVRVERVPDPRIEDARDVIVKVSCASICASDLRIYAGLSGRENPLILGREFMGVVVAVGPRVRNLKNGDRVVVPYPVSCGSCFFCARGLPAHCEHFNTGAPGSGGAYGLDDDLFDAVDEYGSYSGGQAQYVRVPFADVGPRKVPDELSDESALFLSDTLPAGWTAAEWCEIKGGETVAVFGCGSVGLVAMKAARLQGAERVIAIDILPYRREAARRLAGAEAVDPEAEDPVEAVRRLTRGRGADACIDAAGVESGRGLMGSISHALRRHGAGADGLRSAIGAVRRGGVVSAIGMHRTPVADAHVDEIFAKGLRLRGGQAPVQSCIDKLMDMAVSRSLTAEDLVTHRLPLGEAPRAYRMLDEKSEDCLKIVLRPWEKDAPEKLATAVIDELGPEPLPLPRGAGAPMPVF